tara:strand:- start:75 stop:992 length:918 start_codon:yes stop_codon:yes gene_type:complete
MFRDYVNNNDNCVDILYKNMYINQNYEKKKNIISKLKYEKKYKIKDLFLLLNKVIDSSDPDTDVVQRDHCYETAQAIKNNYFIDNNLKDINIRDLFTNEDWFLLDIKYKNLYDTTIGELYKDIKDWSWLILVGLIHDLGKVLVLEEFGKFEEWFSVGDIYPLGCAFHKSNIFYEKNYHKKCIDYDNSKYNTSFGIYDCNVGFDNIEMTFSHDYYLSECLKRSNTNLPYEALYIIRYHSFYSWHTPKNNIRGYEYLANETDWKYLPLLKLFQKSDLYSKKNDFNKNYDVDFFDSLIEKYIIGPINM